MGSEGGAAGADALRDTRLRRAANAAWTGSGDYGSPPPWLFVEEGPGGAEGGATPGPRAAGAEEGGGPQARSVAVPPGCALYANLATGLAAKWFDRDAAATLRASWEGDFRAERLDRTLWFALEEAAFAREDGLRPALGALRADFLGRLSPADRALAAAAAPPAGEDATTGRVLQRVRDLALRLHRFDGRVRRAPDRGLHLGVALLSLALRGASGRREGRVAVAGPLPAARASRGAHGRRPGGGRGRTGGPLARLRRDREERDRAYIENCFGRPLLPPGRLDALERLTCTGVHRGCRLWVADGSLPPGGGGGPAFARMLADAQDQFERNRAFYLRNRAAYEGAAARLAQQLGDRLLGDARLVERGRRAGRLDARGAWRAEALGDGRVFERRVRLDAPDAAVWLLLDGSGSRADMQGEVAAQARVLAAALARCGVAVRTASFCSVRAYTVLRFFDGDARSGRRGPGRGPAGPDGVFRYCAMGMNRDGLALRAAGELLAAEPQARRLLLVLTDAAPLDSRKAAPAEDGRPAALQAARDYAGALAVDDAADAVRALRRRGVAVAALYSGGDALLKDAARIYGTSLVRVRRIEAMASDAAALIADALGC